MKKASSIIIIAAIGTLVSTGCKKVLEKQDIGNFTPSQVFNDSSVAKLDIDYIYSQNQPGWFGNSGGTLGGSYSSICDEQTGDNVYVKGTVTSDQVTDIGTQATSGNYFKIRTINMFLQNMNAGTLDQSVKNHFNGQAYFWRAYRYFELVKLYGGVPLVLTPLDAVGPAAKAAANLPRNTTTETFTQIVKDLDSAIADCPVRWNNNADYGRITSGAAQAFLGRVLLTWASPQFNPGNDVTRWKAAYDASTAAIATLTTNGFGLYPKWDYTMWTTEGSAGGSTPRNPEAVWVTEYNTSNVDNDLNNETYDAACRPKYLSTTGGSNTPTWELAAAFPMKDGKDTLSSSYAYNLQTFFDNRDPRFYQTIAYNGCNWGINGNSTYRVWTYFYPNTKSNPTKTASTESSASASGFYLRKGVDPSLTLTNMTYAGTDWIEMRYAEVLLNQAEAAAEIGNLGVAQEAYANLIAIRKRAGIDAGSDNLYGLTAGMNHDQMINAIMFERKIELAFEGKRYFDLRRRKLLESTLNGKMRNKMVVTLNNNNTYTDYLVSTRDAAANVSLDNVYTTNFTVSIQTQDTYPLAVQSADYFFGIPLSSLQNNVNLIQNNTWGGSFDPLK
ncbi:MAG TPA: RagB/SusD family nutrient uptake outer membrane protein [Puia sp.]|nr:RagB/SusD family nutrient uptake outer membrane protein [Puia sp.]